MLVIVVVILQLLVLGGAVASLRIAAATAAGHATIAADAAAHAAVVTLTADSARDDFEITLQAGALCAIDKRQSVDGGAGQLCAAVIAAAQDAAQRNGAVIVTLQVGADPRAYVTTTAPALFDVIVETEVPGPLARLSKLCADMQQREDLCWARGWSAARSVG